MADVVRSGTPTTCRDRCDCGKTQHNRHGLWKTPVGPEISLMGVFPQLPATDAIGHARPIPGRRLGRHRGNLGRRSAAPLLRGEGGAARAAPGGDGPLPDSGEAPRPRPAAAGHHHGRLPTSPWGAHAPVRLRPARRLRPQPQRYRPAGGVPATRPSSLYRTCFALLNDLRQGRPHAWICS